jgi:LuxR family transcriptional regulator, maltose regulon positive regulatory protein
MTEPIDVHTAVLMLETKLRRPTVSTQHVARPRLLEQLNASAGRQLILVSAPAGYGKTALVSRWLDAVDCPCAWFSVDEHDDDLAAFLLYLVAAIRVVYHDAMSAIELLLQAPTLPAPHRLADALVQDLAALPGPFILAFDDYHTVNAPAIHALMTRLVEHLPAQVHMVLITRADPPLPLVRLRGRQQLGEVRAADLRFSAEETGLLLQQLLGSGVTAETAALLEESTEGWAVGIHLAALSLRKRTDPAAFARQIAAQGNQAITEYLLSEVLAGLPATQRDCLLQSALFERFCASLIDAAQAEGDGKLAGDDFLGAIRRGNLFVVSLDDEGTWCRYHHFFQALLRARLALQYTAAEIKAIHARAAFWFSAQGLVDEAVRHFLAAGDPIAAAVLVEIQVHPALDRENWRQLEHLIGLLPAAMSGRPRLLLAQAWLHFFRWQFAAIEARLDAAESALQADPQAAMEVVLRGEISLLRASLANSRGDGVLTVQYAEAALAAIRPETQYTMGMAQLYYIWGLQSCGQYERAVDFAHRQLEVYGWQANAVTMRLLLALGTIHFEMANLPAMQRITTIWLQLAKQTGFALSIAWSLYGQGWLYYQRNELQAAAAAFQRLAEMAWVAHGRAVVDGYTGLVLIALARGCPEEALPHIDALNERLSERGMHSLAGVAGSLQQRVALARGTATALAWRQGASRGPIAGDLWEQPALTEVRTLLAAGSTEQLTLAAVLLAESRAHALARNSNRRLIEIDALQALVLAAQADTGGALAALQAAVERAAPGGALRLLVDCGPSLIGLLQELKAAGVAPSYIQQVLAAFDVSAASLPAAQPGSIQSAPAPSAAREPTPAELFTNRELDVLSLLAQRLTNKEIAVRLVLSPLTVKKYMQRIYRKLGIDNRRAAVAEARRLGLI